jgi:hypothetical protein
MNEIINELPSGVVIILSIFLVIWSVLLFMLPFFVFGAWRRAKEVSEKMDTLIRIQHLAQKPPKMPKPAKQVTTPRSKDDQATA